MAASNKERQAKNRNVHVDAGMVKVGVWIIKGSPVRVKLMAIQKSERVKAGLIEEGL